MNLIFILAFYSVQAIMGTVISAITGSENPSEVAKMAEQAEEVLSWKYIFKNASLKYFFKKNIFFKF